MATSTATNSLNRVLSTPVEIPGSTRRRSRNPIGPARSCHSTAIDHRLPSRSKVAMIGCPVVEPRTDLPGRGAVDSSIATIL
ncbi:Uncharacterised protein [Mycobacteroides abscessus subsp. abscessus]|nr:Uncharacterised protein [Mycobacteroides abscessus subsp. abscessus]